MYGKKMEYMKEAMLFVITKLTPVDRLSIVTFSDVATRLSPLRCMTPAAQDALKALVHGLQQANNGGPNIQSGLETGLAVIADRVHRKARMADIFLLSDGHQTSGDARQVDPCYVAINTFGFGRGTDHRLMSDIAEKSPFGIYSSAHNRSFSQLLPGLLTVVAQDVELIIMPNASEEYFDLGQPPEVHAMEVALGTEYTAISDAVSGMITINFGRLSAGERRRVVINLTLMETMETEYEYDALIGTTQHSFTAQGRTRALQVPQDISIRRTETPSPDVRRWQLEADIDGRRDDAIRQAIVLTDGKDVNDVQDDCQIVLNRLRTELLQMTAHAYTQDPTPSSSKPKISRRPHRGSAVR
ncbi:hypothetical protein SEVIR_8G254600v4 [Setaria viridis]|uniref:VWFA domain-containing protein n=1 Tax=Setaria viridis TaxID=4556 RepID=A0A4U6TJL1_SETVI|nr:probable E3 ubiquitin-protein ligase WAVH2 [Setaria viridis]TKW02658.1 hypothetical protein SEVIR_8G254600v2 [Setaria viridis]